MGLGPLLILGSPWLVVSSPWLHNYVYDEGWAYLVGGGCEWFSQLNEFAAFGWFAVLVAIGVVVLFIGLWLFRRFHFRSATSMGLIFPRGCGLVVVMSLCFLLSACSKPPESPGAANPNVPVLKVAVYADGRLTVDGAASTVEALRESLRSLSERHGTVWYYREAAQKDPPPIAMEVINAVAGARVPVRLSSRPDYSDSIGPDGRPLPK
jgi:hypothetical protein